MTRSGRDLYAGSYAIDQIWAKGDRLAGERLVNNKHFGLPASTSGGS